MDSWLSGQTDRIFSTRRWVLTPERLIWCAAGSIWNCSNRRQLENIRLKCMPSWLMKDAGLEVSGIMDGSKSWIRGYLGMESEEIAQHFYDEVKQANRQSETTQG